MKIPIAREGFNIIKIFLILSVASYVLTYFSRYFYILTVFFILLFVFSIYFFRDPERNTPGDENLILSPADGTIFEVSREKGKQAVKIFMSPLNVHVQRLPVSGTVKSVEYKKGKFLQAFKPEASEVNEQNIMTLRSPEIGELQMRQIAGVIARRIICWVKEGDPLVQGQRWGMIKFGSQVDLILPENISIEVIIGQKVKAGISVIGRKQ